MFILFLIIFIACGPSEEEIQTQIDEAVNAASESTTTTILQETTTTFPTTTTTTLYQNGIGNWIC